MIHPSTMAGPNWLTGSIGTTNPFQQNASFFRNTPFGGQQGGFGPGNNPFQTQPFGFGSHTTQMQNPINEIVRQVIPNVLASCGINPSMLQSPIGFQSLGQQTPFGSQIPIGPVPFGPQFTSTPWTGLNPTGMDWQHQIQNPQIVAEVVRQVTNQVVQSLAQQTQNPFTQSAFGQNPGFQPFSTLGTSQFGMTPSPFMGISPQIQPFQQQQQPQQLQQLQQQQQFWNLISQVCQATAAAVIASLQQQQQLQNAPFNINSTPSPFGVSPGIPAGVGAF